MNKLTAEEKEEKFKNKTSLQFIGDRGEIKTLGDIIYNMFFNGNFSRRDTEFIFKNGNTRKQTTGSARTIEDTYLLAKYYILEISYKEVEDAIQSMYSSYINSTIKNNKFSLSVFDLSRQQRIPMLSSSWCSTVLRTVHTVRRYETQENINKYLDSQNLNKSL